MTTAMAIDQERRSGQNGDALPPVDRSLLEAFTPRRICGLSRCAAAPRFAVRGGNRTAPRRVGENGPVAHATARSGYRDLVERLNRFPRVRRRPTSSTGSSRSSSPSGRRASSRSSRSGRSASRPPARVWKTSPAEARKTLDALAARALLLDAAGQRRDRLGPAPADGRLLRVLDDAGAGRHRPEGPRRALLPVPQRRGGLRPRALRPGRDAARARLRERGRLPRGATTSSRSSTGSGRARWSRTAPHDRPSASATAATRCRTSAGPATRPSRSA